MPKAAAIQPSEWATIHPGLGSFDIGELNRVVIDYAHIELALAKRWSRRTALGRVCAGLNQCLKVIGLMAMVLLAVVLLAGVDGEALVPVVYAGGFTACAGIVAFFVPWLLTPYRQWDRTLCGISVMAAVAAVASITAIAVRDFEAGPPWLLAVPCVLLLLVSIGAIIADYRLRTTGKPPAVDLATLSQAEIEVLLALRHKTLKHLRARSVVSYQDFAGFDAAPLDPNAANRS